MNANDQKIKQVSAHSLAFFFSKLHIYQCGFTESKLHAVGDCGPQEAMLFCSDGERLSLTFLSP